MPEAKKRSFIMALLPVVFFAGIAAVFFVMLTSSRDPSAIPSALIGKQVPKLALSDLEGAQNKGAPIPGFSNFDLVDPQINKGRVIIVNVWSSWCGPCRHEHPFLMKIGTRPDLMMVGINYKDKTEQALKFLQELGNPFERIGVDPHGRAAINLGVYGVPETYIVSPKGAIKYKHVGPIVTEQEQKSFLKQISEAQVQ